MIKLPAFYIVTSNRTELLYTKLFRSVYKIITQNDLYELNLEFIITDCEESLIYLLYALMQ